MALNRARERANQVALPVPADTASGDIVVIAGFPALALTDIDAWTEGEATVQFECSVYVDVSVAVSVGDIIYRHGSAGAYTYNKTSSGGTAVGFAISEKGSGDGQVEVKLAKVA